MREFLILAIHIATLGGNIAALCFRPRLPLDGEFATHKAQWLMISAGNRRR
jgi:hypothetical protein